MSDDVAGTPGRVLTRKLLTETTVWVGLLVLYVAVRWIWAGSFDMVSHDGTYYVTQARGVLTGRVAGGGAFPPGYPAAIAALMPLFEDGVRAAQAVSLLSGAATVVVVYRVIGATAGRLTGLACAASLATMPLYARLTMMTMSESWYALLVVLGLFAVARGRSGWAGAILGAAAATRPEALGIAVAAMALQIPAARRAAAMASAFVLVYGLSLLLPVLGGDAFRLVPKWQWLGAGALDWKSLEGGPTGMDPLSGSTLIRHHASRLPADLFALFRHATPVFFVVAIVGAWRRRSPWALGFIPLLVNPLFTVRFDPRFVMPFIPIVVILAGTFAASVPRRTAKTAVVVLLMVSSLAGFFLNRSQLTTPVAEDFTEARAAGRRLRTVVQTGDRMADRKPFLAFYAGAEYAEVPRAAYEETLSFLDGEGIEFLGLMRGVTDFFRPSLTALLYDPASILGEWRLEQVYAGTDILAYRRSPSGPIAPQRVAIDLDSTMSISAGPVWSPDGTTLLYSGHDTGGRRGLFLHNPDAGGAGRTRLLHSHDYRVTDLQWSPNGTRVAFVSMARGNADVVVFDIVPGWERYVSTHAAAERSPTWDGDDHILFVSNRGASEDVWRIDLNTGATSRVTSDGDITAVSLTPGAQHMAITRRSGSLDIRDRAGKVKVSLRLPGTGRSPVAWSHDGRYAALIVERDPDRDVFVFKRETGVGLFAGNGANASSVAWRPGGGEWVVSENEGVLQVSGIERYLDRLDHPVAIRPLARAR